MQLLNMRLDMDTSWFMTCIGAVQDAEKQGVVCALPWTIVLPADRSGLPRS